MASLHRRRFLLGLALFLPALGLCAAGPGAPELLLANVYRDGIDPGRYWVSEKLDGVRAYWDGHALYFRSGLPVHPPAWFTAGFPARPLDGELWMDRGRFDRVSGIVRKTEPLDEEWRQVKYMLFELPGGAGDFSARLAVLRDLVAATGVPWLGVVEQFRVADARELKQRMEAVVRGGGEGLMLHRAYASYASGRSDDLLKLKPWLDAEARVVGHVPGTGRLRGLLGALIVELPDGRRLRIGTGFSDAQRHDPPPVGSLVTYRYRELNRNGLPRFASFLRVRDPF
ncbi:MAG: DNA ligase [Pseudomonadota bacterium]